MVLVAAVGGGGDGCSGGSVSQGVRSTTFALARACTDVHIHTRTHIHAHTCKSRVYARRNVVRSRTAGIHGRTDGGYGARDAQQSYTRFRAPLPFIGYPASSWSLSSCARRFFLSSCFFSSVVCYCQRAYIHYRSFFIIRRRLCPRQPYHARARPRPSRPQTPGFDPAKRRGKNRRRETGVRRLLRRVHRC